jgi:hypothetical protein
VEFTSQNVRKEKQKCLMLFQNSTCKKGETLARLSNTGLSLDSRVQDHRAGEESISQIRRIDKIGHSRALGLPAGQFYLVLLD